MKRQKLKAKKLMIASKTLSIISLIYRLEGHTQHESHSVFLSRWQRIIVASVNKLHVKQFEDIVDSCNKFYVWALRIHDITACGEGPHGRISAICQQVWIVLIAQFPPKCLHTKVLSPLKFLQKRNSIE